MISSLKELPSVASYLKRVGAKAVNFKRAVVSHEVNGYPKEVGWASFSPDGTIRVRGQMEPPTAAEAERITAELMEAEFPEVVTLAAIDHPPEGVSLTDGSTLIFHDFEKRICMLQQRIDKADGGKDYVPWTRWSDGQWRRMEPDGALPFYGLDMADQSSVLFLHEGAKAAYHVKRMLAGIAECAHFPWIEDVRFGTHIGWIGGVHALHRSDWNKLASLGWKNVYIITDNDNKGQNIAPAIAKHFRCPTFACMLDRSFPAGFDFADPFPASKFSAEGRYIGEPFRNYLRPCTWATDIVEIDGDPVTVIRDEFAEQWAWIKDQDWFVNLHLTQFKFESAAKFNAGVYPVSDVKNTAVLLQKKMGSTQYGLTYNPSTTARVVTSSAGLSQINTYQPSPIQPVEGNFQPFLDFMEYLIPSDHDRHEVLRWIATLVEKTGTRMAYGLLMMSEKQGTGKTTLGESILAELVGQHNTSFPSERAIADSDFNGWAVNKRLIVVNEIYHGHSWKAYNTLKSYVTDRHIEANIKFMATYTLPNWTHYYLSSNSKAALKIDNDDRRWLVPKLTEEVWPAERFQELYHWLQSGGLAHIAYWAATFERRKEGKYVKAGETAPSTDDKIRLIIESRGEEMCLLQDFAVAMSELDRPCAVSLINLKQWTAEMTRGERSFSTPDSIGRVLVKEGLRLSQPVRIGGRRQWLVVNRPEMAAWGEAQLRQVMKHPGDVLQTSI
jgi:hypothetical protein